MIKQYVLDHGYVELLRVDGDDEFLAQTARTSTQSSGDPAKDAKLVKRLVRDRHTSPIEFGGVVLEIKMPIFVARQWMRHRTGCLSGRTRLHFDLPGGVDRRGNQKYTLTLDEIWERFQPSRGHQGDPYYKRDRVRSMLLRSVNEQTGEIYHTRIKDIWKTGKKEVFLIEAGERKIVASKDHKFFTDTGWLTVKEFDDETQLCVEAAVAPKVPEQVFVVQTEPEIWKPMKDVGGRYLISSHGRLKRVKASRGAVVGRIKEPTIANTGYLVCSISIDGVTHTKQMHREVYRHFISEVEEGNEVRHLDGNKLNLTLTNLEQGTPLQNSADTKRYGGKPVLGTTFVSIDRVDSIGVMNTYDIEVEGPHHNFIADGYCVHNSFNEFSMRYSEAPEEFYVPDAERCQAQSTFNKQGSAEFLGDAAADLIMERIRLSSIKAYEDYQHLLRLGLTRELARSVLPVNFYTKVRWKIDLHNLMHFIKLREDPHAQYEIRVYAEVIHKMLSELFPAAMEAFEQHVQNKIEVSPELAASLASALDRIAGLDEEVVLTSEELEFLKRNQ